MVLQCKETGDFKPHPEGIHPAVCVDVMDLGLVETEFQGQRRMVNKVKVVFESEAKTEDGKPCMVSKNFTASLHPKAKLAEFLGKWRGRLVVPGETIELAKLIGASCTLVISHQQNMVGKTYANIDAISKPTRKVTPSGTYDPAAARQRYAEWKAKQAGGQRPEVRGQNGNGGQAAAPAPTKSGFAPQPSPGLRQPSPVPSGHPLPSDGRGGSPAPAGEGQTPADFDPEVGF